MIMEALRTNSRKPFVIIEAVCISVLHKLSRKLKRSYLRNR